MRVFLSPRQDISDTARRSVRRGLAVSAVTLRLVNLAGKLLTTGVLLGLFMIPAAIVIVIAGAIFEQAGPEANALFAFAFCLVFTVVLIAVRWADMRNPEGGWNLCVAVPTLLAVGFVSIMTIASREAALTVLCIGFVIAAWCCVEWWRL